MKVQFGTAYRFDRKDGKDGAKANLERAVAFAEAKRAAGIDAEDTLTLWTSRKDGKPELRIDRFVLTNEGMDKALTRFRLLNQALKGIKSEPTRLLPIRERKELDRIARELENVLLVPALERANIFEAEG